MTPVDAGSTLAGGAPSACATTAVARRAAARPGLPVHAFAQPALTRTAQARPARTRSAARVTGAARTRLVVNTAAAVHGRSATSSARSGAPDFSMPAASAAQRNPSTTGSETSTVAREDRRGSSPRQRLLAPANRDS